MRRVDCVEGADVLVVVEGGDDGDDVRLDDMLRHDTQHGLTSGHGAGPRLAQRPVTRHHEPAE